MHLSYLIHRASSNYFINFKLLNFMLANYFYENSFSLIILNFFQHFINI